MTADRAALVERVARAMALCEDYDENSKDMVGSFEDAATAAIALIRNEVLEEAIECLDKSGCEQGALAIRALKEASCSSS
jgi:hypothetical protein